jgi:CRISPR-associated exonuclease Cas4
MIMQRQRQQHQSQQMFTANEVADFEYCPMLWWHEEFEPLTRADTEELFARMVEMENDYGQAATAQPEYQVIEQLLLRRGAFNEGHQDDLDDLEEGGEREEVLREDEHIEPVHAGNYVRTLTLVALVMLVLALLLIPGSFLLASRGLTLFQSIALPAGLVLLILALALFLLLINERRRQMARLQVQRRRDLGLPSGDLVYEDADGQGEPLTSTEFPLLGKPTYVVRLSDGRPVPIVLKPNVQNLREPQSNHAAQIGAYCLILESYDDLEPPTHGVLRYADREFVVDYTPTLRKKVIRILKDMGNCSEQYPPSLTRQRATKCRSCLFQPICPVGQGK